MLSFNIPLCAPAALRLTALLAQTQCYPVEVDMYEACFTVTGLSLVKLDVTEALGAERLGRIEAIRTRQGDEDDERRA
jgi:hypothetical protein